MDTGARANLIKKWLVANLAKPCKGPLRLVTANGDVLPGGDTEVDLIVHFRERGVDVGPGKERVWRAKGCFPEAEIEDDMILGYPWWQANRVAVLSADRVLAVGEGCRDLVEGWVKITGPAKGKTLPTWSIRKRQLGLLGRTSGGDIPSFTRLDEDELLVVMN